MKHTTAPPGHSAHQIIKISTAIGDPQSKKASKTAIGTGGT